MIVPQMPRWTSLPKVVNVIFFKLVVRHPFIVSGKRFAFPTYREFSEEDFMAAHEREYRNQTNGERGRRGVEREGNYDRSREAHRWEDRDRWDRDHVDYESAERSRRVRDDEWQEPEFGDRRRFYEREGDNSGVLSREDWQYRDEWRGDYPGGVRRERGRQWPEHRPLLQPTGAQRESFAGRGPKGYRRSDERIEEDVCERLTVHPAIDASEIEVSVSGGDVTLKGTVNNRAEKHLAESMTETVSGVKEVYNQLRITQPQTGLMGEETQSLSPRRER